MFLTVPKGKNVSIVCRVSSDPVSQITWFFNGRPLVEDDSAKNQQVGKFSNAIRWSKFV
jgi:hypothetical protein